MKQLKTILDWVLGTYAPIFTCFGSKKIILCYHRFTSEQSNDPYHNPAATTPIASLEQQLLWLKSFGNIEPLQRLICSPASDRKWSISITIDDGYQDVIDLALPIFEKHHVPFTWFLTTDPIKKANEIPWWDLSAFLEKKLEVCFPVRLNGTVKNIDLSEDKDVRWIQCKLKQMHLFGPPDKAKNLKDQVLNQLKLCYEIPCNSFTRPELLKEAAKSGYLSVAPHTVTHSNLAQLPRREQEQEIIHSINTLEEWGLNPENLLSFPYGKPWARNGDTIMILNKLGISAGLTTDGDFIKPSDSPYLLPRVSIDGRWDIQTFKARVVYPSLYRRLRFTT